MALVLTLNLPLHPHAVAGTPTESQQKLQPEQAELVRNRRSSSPGLQNMSWRSSTVNHQSVASADSAHDERAEGGEQP